MDCLSWEPWGFIASMLKAAALLILWEGVYAAAYIYSLASLSSRALESLAAPSNGMEDLEA